MYPFLPLPISPVHRPHLAPHLTPPPPRHREPLRRRGVPRSQTRADPGEGPQDVQEDLPPQFPLGAPTPSSPSSPAWASPARMSPPSSSTTRSCSAPTSKKTLAPRVVKLSDLGLSRPEIGRLILASRNQFCGKYFLRKVESGRRIFGSHELLQVSDLPTRHFLRKLEFWHRISGSHDEPHRLVKVNNGILSIDLDKVAIPNVSLLEQRGITVSDLRIPIARRLMSKSTEQLIRALAFIDEFEIQQSSPVFLCALVTFATINSEMLTNNIQLFEKLGWSKNEISLAVSQKPQIIRLSEERLRRSLEFLTGKAGLEIPYIAQNPALILCKTQCRLLPRHWLMKFLKAKGLLKCDFSFDFVAMMGEKEFLDRFVHPYKEGVPGLAAVYASSCAGKHQWDQLYEMDNEKRDDACSGK